MTARQALHDAERRHLLECLTGLRTDDDDAVAQDPKWFLPFPGHQRAVRSETLVVRGGRGSGKSALFQYLGQLALHPELRALWAPTAASDTTWVVGHGSGPEHPPPLILGRFAENARPEELRLFWFGRLCARLAHTAGTPLPDGPVATCLEMGAPLEDFVRAVGSQLDRLAAWTDQLERSRDAEIVLTYDGLDRIDNRSIVRNRLASSLLALWLSLADRYRRIRPKIFLREDLFQSALVAFPDASKLDARSVSLDWRVEDLYRILIKHMANLDDRLCAWIESSARAIPLTSQGPLGLMPPESLPETGRASQKSFADHLAGEQMGSGEKKGYTYRWIPNRLQDAHARVVPRSILSLVRNAADQALRAGPAATYLRLLHPSELVHALERTSKRRTTELQEEFPVVARLENLRGEEVMLPRKRAVEALASPPGPPPETENHLPDEFGHEGEAVLRALLDLGAMSERPDGRIDVPDIYRYHFGILRRGGVRRPR